MTTFKKDIYKDRAGYSIKHTIGKNATGSTLNYPHNSSTYMLFFFVNGQANITVEGSAYKVQSGEIFITNPTELFLCAVDPNAYHERIVLHIHESFFDKSALLDIFCNREKGLSNRIPANIVRSHGLDQILLEILKLAQDPNEFNEILEKCKITELLVKLNQMKALIGNDTSDSQSVDHSITPIISYLNGHFQQKITIADLANQFAMSPSHLSHIFKEHTGLSVMNYVIFKRLHYFNCLVTNGYSIEKACYESGFHNYCNFYRLYKKYNGITPIQFKMRYQKYLKTKRD